MYSTVITIYLDHSVCLVFYQLKCNVCVRCYIVYSEPMHHNKPNITYLFTCTDARQSERREILK